MEGGRDGRGDFRGMGGVKRERGEGENRMHRSRRSRDGEVNERGGMKRRDEGLKVLLWYVSRKHGAY